jgi:glutamyl-Q tRNA(Asp) synthetase
VVVDDALQGVTDIVRGVDLFEATHLHRVLQSLLDLPVPTYHHHDLLTDPEGNRLAKRDRAITLKSLRENGVSAADLRRELGFGG